MNRAKIIIIILFLGQVAQAELDLKPSFKRDVRSEFVVPHESIIEIGGVKFKKIEFNGRLIIINHTQPEQIVDCSRIHLPPETNAARAAVQVTKRTRVFLEGFQQTCADKRVETNPNLKDGKLGLGFDENGPATKPKEIYVKPLQKSVGAGFSF